jgi:hypothetical protein
MRLVPAREMVIQLIDKITEQELEVAYARLTELSARDAGDRELEDARERSERLDLPIDVAQLTHPSSRARRDEVRQAVGLRKLSGNLNPHLPSSAELLRNIDRP